MLRYLKPAKLRFVHQRNFGARSFPEFSQKNARIPVIYGARCMDGDLTLLSPRSLFTPVLDGERDIRVVTGCQLSNQGCFESPEVNLGAPRKLEASAKDSVLGGPARRCSI